MTFKNKTISNRIIENIINNGGVYLYLINFLKKTKFLKIITDSKALTTKSHKQEHIALTSVRYKNVSMRFLSLKTDIIVNIFD